MTLGRAVCYCVCLALLDLAVASSFTPAELSPQTSQECSTSWQSSSAAFDRALATIAKLVMNNTDPSFLSKSCMEIQELFPKVRLDSSQ